MKSTFAELLALDPECEEIEHSLTKLQEELEDESTLELEWQSQSQIDEDSEQLLKEAIDCKAALNSQLKKSEERATQWKQVMILKQTLMGDKRNESSTKNEVKIESGRESQLQDEKYTPRKNSRTRSHQDKVEMQDIANKYKLVSYVDKKVWSGTQISLR